VVKDQLRALAAQDRETLIAGFPLGLGFALWSANSGVKVLFDGLNVAYDENKKRGAIRLNLLSFIFTFGAVLIGVAFIVSVGIVPAILAFFSLSPWTELLVRWGRWSVMLAATTAAVTLIYRYGPSREPPKLRWLTWGAALASVVWIIGSWAFAPPPRKGMPSPELS
jgi:membrane protein